jgi:hypothetical protein
MVETEIQKMDDDFDSNLKAAQGQHPRLFVLYLRGVISPETIIILNQLSEFFSYWDKKMGDDLVWPDEHKKLKKYQPFFINSVDLARFRSIIINRFKK